MPGDSDTHAYRNKCMHRGHWHPSDQPQPCLAAFTNIYRFLPENYLCRFPHIRSAGTNFPFNLPPNHPHHHRHRSVFLLQSPLPPLTLPQFPAVRPFLRMKPPFVELMGPRVQKVLPTVLISHNYTITKRTVFQHTPRLLPPPAPCPSPLGTPRTMPTARHGNEHSKKNAGKMKILFLPATKLKCSGKNSRYMYMKPKKRDI